MTFCYLPCSFYSCKKKIILVILYDTMKRTRQSKGQGQGGSKSASKANVKASNAVVPEKKDEDCERRFFWSCYKDSGFPHRVNHAVASCTDACGNSYMYSVGGYHADDDQRTVLQADSIGGPFFKRSPIDVHSMDVGKVCLLCDIEK